MKKVVLFYELLYNLLVGFSQIGADNANTLLRIPLTSYITKIKPINNHFTGLIVYNLDNEKSCRYAGTTGNIFLNIIGELRSFKNNVFSINIIYANRKQTNTKNTSVYARYKHIDNEGFIFYLQNINTL